uniref:Uncharacterized protein n=1 Tax=Nelumbo nucifera TaxID=4432 RepID=A0A822ZCN2_NELNU|nr:TPA_asm: hypothetical protein HUJ06_000510 [Nelumbo nucifera]
MQGSKYRYTFVHQQRCISTLNDTQLEYYGHRNSTPKHPPSLVNTFPRFQMVLQTVWEAPVKIKHPAEVRVYISDLLPF